MKKNIFTNEEKEIIKNFLEKMDVKDFSSMNEMLEKFVFIKKDVWIFSEAIKTENEEIINWFIKNGFANAENCERTFKIVGEKINNKLLTILESVITFRSKYARKEIFKHAFRSGNFKGCDDILNSSVGNPIDLRDLEKDLFFMAFGFKKWNPFHIRFLLKVMNEELFNDLLSYIGKNIKKINIFSLGMLFIEGVDFFKNKGEFIALMMKNYNFADEYIEEEKERNSYLMSLIFDFLIINNIEVNVAPIIDAIKETKLWVNDDDDFKDANFIDLQGGTFFNAFCSFIAKKAPKEINKVTYGMKGWSIEYHQILLKYIIDEDLKIEPK